MLDTPVNVEIACLNSDHTVQIANAERVAEAFFSIDPSSRGAGSLDAHSLVCASDRIERVDLTVLNATMRARSPEK